MFMANIESCFPRRYKTNKAENKTRQNDAIHHTPLVKLFQQTFIDFEELITILEQLHQPSQ